MPVDGHCASVLGNSPLVNIHCILKEDFIVRPLGLGCIDLVCRHVHLSFVDRMAERRISLVPRTNGRVDVEDLFGTANSPVLISLLTSCDFKVNRTYHCDIVLCSSDVICWNQRFYSFSVSVFFCKLCHQSKVIFNNA